MKALKFLTAAAVAVAGFAGAAQSETIKVGLILPMTGPFASTGRAVESAAKLYMQQHGNKVGGHTIELVVQDDTGAADTTRRIAQEMVVRGGVKVLGGFGLTPLAMAAAPVAEQAKVPMVVMAAATSVITTKSQYIARTSFTLPQAAVGIAEWAPKNGIKSVVTMVSDYAPGIDAEKSFTEVFTRNGGKVVEQLRVPLANPDFSPFMQRVKDSGAGALFIFVPSGVGSAVMKEFQNRGLAEAGMKLIGTGDVVDDDILNQMGPAALGTVTSHHYSAAHDSAENKTFVSGYKALTGNRPNFMAVGGYDGMRLIYAAIEKAGGKVDGDSLIAAMKGMSWTSPRGPVSIDPETRDIVQNIYIRRVEKQDGELHNVEFDVIKDVKDPGKAKK
ncbi:MAG: ABC transporter substrate-binding protein [Rhodospirillales bacterium]|nr:ABC transporter substrate-binding protein [Rhodospirillales bacterium]